MPRRTLTRSFFARRLWLPSFRSKELFLWALHPRKSRAACSLPCARAGAGASSWPSPCRAAVSAARSWTASSEPRPGSSRGSPLLAPHGHERARKTGQHRDGVHDLAQVDALPDLVRVLLDARPDSEHGRVLHGARRHPAFARWNGDRSVVDAYREADAVRGEDPPVHAWLLAESAALASGGDVRRDDAAIRGDGGLNGRMLLGCEPAHVDLRVVEDEAGPRRLVVSRHGDVDRQPRRPRGGHGGKTFDVGHRLLGCLSDREAPVEAEDEALGDGAVARRVEAGPRGRARAVPQERVVEEAVPRVVTLRRFDEDGRAPFQRIPPFPRHRSVAGFPGHAHLDLHAAALTAVDPERPLRGIARALREDDDIGDELRRGSRQ